jgi:hypothetical protein
MDRPYIVALQDGNALTGPERIAAECRFISSIEKSLGEPRNVASAYEAWVAASESQATDVDGATAALATKWAEAYELAARAGLVGVGGCDDGGFDVRIARAQ